jgi:hypothetical protein
LVRTGQPGDAIDGRGLARAVGFKKAEIFTLPDVEINAGQSLNIAESFGQPKVRNGIWS